MVNYVCDISNLRIYSNGYQIYLRDTLLILHFAFCISCKPYHRDLFTLIIINQVCKVDNPSLSTLFPYHLHKVGIKRDIEITLELVQHYNLLKMEHLPSIFTQDLSLENI